MQGRRSARLVGAELPGAEFCGQRHRGERGAALVQRHDPRARWNLDSMRARSAAYSVFEGLGAAGLGLDRAQAQAFSSGGKRLA